MNRRLKIKCVLASAVLHGSLLVALIVGAAFASRHKEEDSVAVLTMIPDKVIDALGSGGGGNPEITTPAVAPKATTPLPALPLPTVPPVESKQKEAQPEPPAVEPVKPVEKPRHKPADREVGEEINNLLKDIDEQTPKASVNPKIKVTNKKPKETPKSDAPSPSKPPKRQIEVNLNAVKPSVDSIRESRRRVEAAEKARADAEARSRAIAEAYRTAQEQRSQAFNGALQRLGQGLSSGTAIDMPGPGGEAFANYGLVVRSIYDAAWNPPSDAPDDSATVQVKIVVARDGHIVSSEIIRKSGNVALDKSVQRALNSVRQLPAFPAESNDSERIFNINFNLKAKRQIG